MGIISSIKRMAGSVMTGGSLTDNADGFWDSLGSTSTSGKKITNETAMRLYSVYACVSLISETLAQLPLKLKRELANNSTEDATDLPLYDILKNVPNPEMSSFNWRESGQGHLLLGGNKMSFVERSRMGIKGLWPIDPKHVTVKRVKNTDINKHSPGRRNPIIYEISTATGKQQVPSRDMLHVPGFGFNGLVGESVVQNFARESIGNGLSLEEFLGMFFKQGVATSGVLEHPKTLGNNKEAFLAKLKQRFTGKNVGTPMVLENGMKWNQMKISLADQQFLELMQMNPVQICGIFKVPPFKIGIHGKNTSFNNTEQQNKSFLDTTMMQWLIRDEQAMNMQLLTKQQRAEGLFIKYNLDSMLRPDAETRGKIDQIHWGMGVPLNEFRRRDDLPPVEGGDKSYVPLNYLEVGTDRDAGFETKSMPEIRARQIRSVAGRDRLARTWSPRIRQAAEKIMRRESRSLLRALGKTPTMAEFKKFVNDFYDDKMPQVIRSEMFPVLSSFMVALQATSAGEVGADEGVDDSFQIFMNDYNDGFSRQYIQSSRGQMIDLADKSEDLEPIIERVGEWEEKRPDKVDNRQSNTIPNGVAAFVFASVGVGSIWAIRGPKTCPYCTSLSGQRVSPGGIFVRGGTDIDPSGGDGPMNIRNNTRYPQLHEGCDCFVVPG